MKALRHAPLILFGVACLVAQTMPLLNVLGYEYASLVGVLFSVLGTWHVTQAVGPLGEGGICRWRLAARGAVRLAMWLAAAAVIGALNMLRVRNCAPGVGLLYMLVLGGGAIPMAVASGLVLAHIRSPWRRVGLLAGLVLASLASTLATLALEPAIVAYDTYLGYYAGSIYDESLTGFGPHIVFRVWNLCWGALLVALLALHRRPTRRDARIVWLCAVAIVSIYAFRGGLGIERDRDYVIDALGGHFAGERFDIYYDARATDADRLALLINDHEARYDELAAFWGVEPSHRFVSFVYANQEQKGALMGGRRTLVAKIWLGEMHITWDGLGDELLAHEMAHLFLRDAGNGPLKLASANGLTPIMALVEGAATAAAWGASELDYHHWSSAIYALDLGEDIETLLGPAGFWSRYSRRAYTLTGSFVRWLIDTHGPAPFLEAYTAGDFEGAYGASLSELTAQWRTFLGTLTLTEEQLEVARYRYDRPSLFGKRCARSIATRFDEGDAAFVRGDMDEAARCYEGILADDPDNVGYRLRIAGRYDEAGHVDAAVAHATQIAAADGAGRAYQDRAREMLADIAWTQGDTTEALAMYNDLLQSVGSSGARRRILAKRDALRDRATRPLTASAVRRYLATRPAPPATTVVAELSRAAAVESSPLAAYLLVLRLAVSDDGEIIDAVASEIAPEALDASQNLRLREAVAMAQTQRGDAAMACETWAQVLALSPIGSSSAAAAEMWRGRCVRGNMPDSG